MHFRLVIIIILLANFLIRSTFAIPAAQSLPILPIHTRPKPVQIRLPSALRVLSERIPLALKPVKFNLGQRVVSDYSGGLRHPLQTSRPIGHFGAFLTNVPRHQHFICSSPLY